MQVVIDFVITVKPSSAFIYITIPNLQWLLQIADKNRQVEWFIIRSFWKNLMEVVSNSQHLADRNIKFQLGLQIKFLVNYNPQITGRQK